MTARRQEAWLLAAALLIGGMAFVLARANMGVSDAGTARELLLVVLGAVLTHLGIRRFAPHADPILLPTVVLLNLLGLVMIHRLDVAEAARAARQGAAIPSPTFASQTAWTLLGMSIALAVLVLMRDHRQLQRYTYTSMVAGLALLLMPLLPVVGTTVNGARLWVRVGTHSFQPGEFAKFALAVFFAGFLVLKRDSLAGIRVRVWRLGWPRPRDLGPILVSWLLSVAILVFERDLGMSLLFFGMFIVLLYMATGQRTWLVLGGVLFVIGSALAWMAFWHVRIRFDIWLDPFAYAYESVPGDNAKGTDLDDPEGVALWPDRAEYDRDPNKGRIVFTGDLTLRVGDHTFNLLHTPGHTPGQIAVHVPEERVVFTGDTIFSGCQTWLMTSDVEQWLAALERIRTLDVDWIVPGHGPVVAKSYLDVQRSHLMEWKAAVATAVANGWSRDETIARIDFRDRFGPVDIGQGYMLDYIQNLNAASLYDKLTGAISGA